jgi:hypothetical protein
MTGLIHFGGMKMIRKILAFSLVVVLVGMGSMSVLAQPHKDSTQLFRVPITKETGQWKVVLGDVEKYESKMAKPKKGVYDMYSLNVTNIGKRVYNVKIEGFRNEPNSVTKHGLFKLEVPKELRDVKDVSKYEHGHEFLQNNFPVSVNANEIEVVITWKEDSKGRDYQQVFKFIKK